MGTKKKTTELIFNLQWRDKPDDGGDKSNIIGMYDIPTTTSSFTVFKSYLLKNSGVACNDVKVTYVTDNGQHWVIDSQDCFEVALNSFRLKARLGEVIYLKLDKQITRKPSNDVETQSEGDGGSLGVQPPEWFLAYMDQFKREIIDEVAGALSSQKPEPTPILVPPIQKIKPESSKRSKKNQSSSDPLELIKSLKFDRKLESKIENKLSKLDAKAKKLKEKKIALSEQEKQKMLMVLSLENMPQGKKKSASSEQEKVEMELVRLTLEDLQKGEYKDKPIPGLVLGQALEDRVRKYEEEEIENQGKLEGYGPVLSAALSNPSKAGVYERMIGGEVYLHSWEVLNNGKIPWSPNTELRMTWGSADLIPSRRNVECPTLKPQEKATISVRFQIPRTPGSYESYWNFYDENIRFGHTLSCCVLVEQPLRSIISEVNEEIVVVPPEKKIHPQKRPFLEVASNLPLNPFEQPDQDSFEEIISVKTESSPDSPEMKAINEMKVQLENQPPISEQINVFPHPTLRTVATSSPVSTLGKESDLCSNCAIMDLSKRMEESKLESDSDSDSDWESLSERKSRGKEGSNKYGINENDLIVDLSTKVKEEENVGELVNVNVEDDNNNGTMDNNNHTEHTALISDVSSESSSVLSAGYDVVHGVDCEEKEDASGYVYITIDGNKLPVPKYILRPDFLATAEEAPGPLTSLDLIPTDKKDPTEAQTSATSPKPSPDSLPGRLFVFPENQPGYEVVTPAQEEPKQAEASEECVQDAPREEKQEEYRWAPYDSSGNPIFHPSQKSDKKKSPKKSPWGRRHTPPRPPRLQNIPPQFANPPLPPPMFHREPEMYCPSPPVNFCPINVPQFGCSPPPPPHTGFHHVPNYQQTVPKPAPHVDTPSAPPQQQPTDLSPDRNVPVHILPENLVSGAVSVASSAINTARSVINMIVPPRAEGRYGQWVDPQSIRAKNLCILAEMGFWDSELNASLLERFHDDVGRVVSELVK